MRVVRWVVCVSLFAAILLFTGQSLSAAPPHDAIADLDAFITQALKDYNVPGAAVAVVENGKVVMAKGFGVRDVTKTDKVDENTIFQLASVTKAFTGAAAATVVDSGKMEWDTPIVNYIPEFVGYDPYMTRWLTQRDLLAHRTGWPAFQGDMVDAFGYDRAEIVYRLRYFKPAYSLREVAQYSNMGYFMSGETSGRASNQTWNQVVEKGILTPLEMKRSSTITGESKDPNMAANHALVDGKIQVVEPSILNTTGAASSMTSTASDMSRFLLMLLNKGTYNGTPVLTPESVAEMFKRSMVAEIEFSDLPPISETTGFFNGLGVDSYNYGGYQIVEKAGALAGVRTIFTLIPEKNVGIVILANMNLTALPEAVRAFYLNQQLGFDTTTDQKELLEINAQIAKLLVGATPPVNPGTFNGTLQSLVGVYENDYYGTCEITLKGQELGTTCGPAKLAATLTHWSNGAFAMQFPGATQAPGITTFTIGEDGTADSFTHDTFGTFTRVKQ